MVDGTTAGCGAPAARTTTETGRTTQPASAPRRRAGSTLLVAMLLGALAGMVLTLSALMDWTSFANLAFAGCLFLAHVCVGILVGFVINGALNRGQGKKAMRTLRWIAVAPLVGYAVWLLDSFMFGLGETPGWRAIFIVLAVVGVLAGVVWEVCAVHVGSSDRKNTRHLLSAVAALPVGALVVLVAIDHRSDQRQAAFDIDARDELPVIALPSDRPTYVALGDSYSAGEGIEPFLGGTEQDCHRSPFAFPRLLRFASDDPKTASDDLTNVEFRACSGAVTADIDLGVAGGVPQQLDPRARDDIGLVTITVGGNDVVFSTVVRECILFDECASRTFDSPHTSPQYPDITYPDSAVFGDWATAALGEGYLATRIERVYSSVRATYPRARIVAVGYPYLFPAGGPPSVWELNDCASLLRRVDGSERKALRAKIDELNVLLATKASAENIEFVSPQAAWDGHEACGARDQWTNAVRLDLKRAASMRVVNGSSFHPNRRGQLELARLVSCYLSAHPTAVDSRPTQAIPGSSSNPIVAGSACAAPAPAD